MNDSAPIGMQSPKLPLMILLIAGISSLGLLVLPQAVMSSQAPAKVTPLTNTGWMIAQKANTSIKTSLAAGATGAKVKELQQRLKEKGFEPGAIDSTFGPSTKAAVIAFQRLRGLQADGIAGPQTLAALGIKLSSTSSPTSTASRLTKPKSSQSAKNTPSKNSPNQPLAANVLAPKPTVVADRFYWSGAKGNLGLSLVGKFNSTEKMVETFNLSRVLSTFSGKQWKLNDILVSSDFNADINTVNWKVSGPRPVVERYLASLKAGYQDQSLLADFGFSEINFQPTAASESGQ